MERKYSEKVHDNIMNKTAEWLKEFEQTPYYGKLTKGQKKDAQLIVEAFTEMNYTYQLRRPREWTKVSLSYVLCDLFPAKIGAKKSFFKHVEAVLTQYLLFLGEGNKIKNSRALIVSLNEHADIMVELSDDESNWGFGKQIMSQADALGFDMGDEEEIAKFIDLYNKTNKK